MMQPTNHGLQDHLWRYFSSLETRSNSSSGNNVSAVGDNHDHQWTNPRFIMPSDEEEMLVRRSGGELDDHHQYGDSINSTDLRLSRGRSFIADNNYSTAPGSDHPFLSSSSSSADHHQVMIRGLDPQMSSAGTDQQWRLVTPSSSLGYTPMLHHPLPIQTSQTTPLFTASHKMEGLGSTHHGMSTAGSLVTKRPAPAASFQRPEKSQADHAKKSRCSPMSRSTSCPVLKVRKEKLGDRIAALQKLVAPFGKTDTASVLTEAIGYIQFLHDQVQKLSVPYMKTTGRAVQVISRQLEEGKEEQKADLQNRGLCLVPQSWASFFISSAGFGV